MPHRPPKKKRPLLFMKEGEIPVPHKPVGKLDRAAASMARLKFWADEDEKKAKKSVE